MNRPEYRARRRAQVRGTTLPKPTDAGNPDFRLWNGTDRIIGYVEAKKPTEERRAAIEESEQLARYRATFPNLLLTNFFEFRPYRNGERVPTVLADLHRLRSPDLDRTACRFEGKGGHRVGKDRKTGLRKESPRDRARRP